MMMQNPKRQKAEVVALTTSVLPDPEVVTSNAWVSPSQAMDMVYDVRAEGCEDLGFSLLRPRSRGFARSAANLVRAKLQPAKPMTNSWTTRCGLPVTACDHRLVLAPNVADPVSIEGLLHEYDAKIRPHHRLLAAVLTMKFDPDVPRHESFSAVCCFAELKLARARRLSSIVCLHEPGEGVPHAHIVVLARRHMPCGWLEVDPDLSDDAHELWADEWRGFLASWSATAK